MTPSKEQIRKLATAQLESRVDRQGRTAELHRRYRVLAIVNNRGSAEWPMIRYARSIVGGKK
jgi:hypothetical protein